MSRHLLAASLVVLLPAPALAYINAGFKSRAEYARYLEARERARLLFPLTAYDFLCRADVYRSRREWQQALADYTRAIRLAPKDREARLGRGIVLWEREEYARALADYREAVRLTGDFPDARPFLHLAAAYAACPDARLRDRSRAVATARRACELTKYEDAECVQVLAALHALAGDFKAAARVQARALKRTRDADPGGPARRRLERFRLRGLAALGFLTGQDAAAGTWQAQADTLDRMSEEQDLPRKRLEKYRRGQTPDWDFSTYMTGPAVPGK
jgi:tetratricopeptide (TPR) repeat protein